MSSSLIVFLTIASTVATLLWMISLRRLSTIEVARLFEPATFSLVVFSFTCLIGLITIMFVGQDEYFNKTIYKYNDHNLSLSLTVVVSLIFITMTWASRWNIGRNLPRLRTVTPLKIIDSGVLFLILGILTYAVYSRTQELATIFSASNQYEIMESRKQVDAGWTKFFLNKLIVQGVIWILFLNLVLKRNMSERIPDLCNPLIWIVFILYAVYSIASLQKLTLIYFIISVLVAANYDRTVKLITLLKTSIYLFILMFAIYFLLIKNINLSYMLSPFEEGLVGRIFISEISSVYPHFLLFGDQIPHIGLDSISSSLSKAMGTLKIPRSGEMVMEHLNPHWVDMGIGGTYNTIFIGEAYANFGWSGVVFSIIWVPIYYVLIATYIRKFCAKYSAALYIYCSLNISMMSGFNDFLYNPFLILLLLMFTDYRKLVGGFGDPRYKIA